MRKTFDVELVLTVETASSESALAQVIALIDDLTKSSPWVLGGLVEAVEELDGGCA